MEKDNYAEHLKRLQEEQGKALQETDEKINQWQTFKSDYEALKERLKTLPDKLTHDVMVPFGKMAFMPGHLVHTNEILVLLGDNWFVERSAKQAAEIVDRRMNTVDKQLEDLFKQRKLLEPRKEFTSELQSMSQGSEGVMDIREEYDEEKEKEWRVTHKKNVQKHRRCLKEKQIEDQSAVTTRSNQSTKTDEELWARLDQLEQIELQRKEIQKIGKDDDVSSQPLDLPWSNKRVSGKIVESETGKEKVGPERHSQNSVSKDLDSDDDEEEEEEEEEVTGGRVIHFHHTKSETVSELGEASASQQRETDTIESPLDIYTKFASCFGPRSILKRNTEHKKQRRKKTRERKVAFDTDANRQAEAKQKQISPDREKQPQQTAFSDTVIENPSPNVLPQKQIVESSVPKGFEVEPHRTISDAKPVSRFKAQRLGKNIR